MKKFSTFVAILFAAVALCGLFGSCKKETEPSGVKADKFAGTYRLATMSAEIDGETSDLMKTRGVDEFLVIGKEGTGFLSHEQTDGKFTCRVVKLEFLGTSENEELSNSYDNFLVNGIYKVSHVESNPEDGEAVNPYAYFVFDIDAVAQTITQYYAYKADVTKKGDTYVLADTARKKSEPIKYSFRKMAEGEFTLSFNGETYAVSYANGKVSISSEVNTLYETDATDPDALATEILADYLSSL